MSSSASGPTYPGQRLGLPEDGPGSVAGWARRIAALVIDWFASMLVAALFVGVQVWTGTGAVQWATMVVFLAEVTVFTALAGGSFGQLVLRLTVRRLGGAPLNLLQALVRTVLICLVVPPLVFNRDQRGLHDMAVGSITLNRR